MKLKKTLLISLFSFSLVGNVYATKNEHSPLLKGLSSEQKKEVVAVLDAMDGLTLFQSERYSEALPYLKSAATYGDVTSQRLLAYVYFLGENGVKKDFHQARKWFQKAAEQGDAESQFQLGAIYYTGDGVKRNIQASIKWFDKSCKNGIQKACEILSKLK